MSLRTDYTGALDTALALARGTGYNHFHNDAADSDLSGTPGIKDTITADMASAAAQGLKTFTLTYIVTFQPNDLRLGGPLWSAYQSGVREALYSEDLMGNEVVVNLNTSDAAILQVDLVFTF